MPKKKTKTTAKTTKNAKTANKDFVIEDGVLVECTNKKIDCRGDSQ